MVKFILDKNNLEGAESVTLLLMGLQSNCFILDLKRHDLKQEPPFVLTAVRSIFPKWKNKKVMKTPKNLAILILHT